MIRFYCITCNEYYRDDSEGLLGCPLCNGKNIMIVKMDIK